MQKIVTILFSLSFIGQLTAQQRTVAECTVVYKLSTDSTNKELTDALKNGIQTVYIKGNKSRTDLEVPSFIQTTFVVKDTGNVTVLRTIGDNKLMTFLTHKKWVEMNNQYDSAIITPTNETKKILGYDCKKINVQLKNGDVYQLFYATNITPSVKDFEWLFKKIPGFVLEYEVQQLKGIKVKYTATKINLSPVPALKMEIPKTGYRYLEEKP